MTQNAVGAQVESVGHASVYIVLAPETSAVSSGVRVRSTRRFTESFFELSIFTSLLMDEIGCFRHPRTRTLMHASWAESRYAVNAVTSLVVSIDFCHVGVSIPMVKELAW